jgi:hypothetical protein
MNRDTLFFINQRRQAPCLDYFHQKDVTTTIQRAKSLD